MGRLITQEKKDPSHFALAAYNGDMFKNAHNLPLGAPAALRDLLLLIRL